MGAESLVPVACVRASAHNLSYSLPESILDGHSVLLLDVIRRKRAAEADIRFGVLAGPKSVRLHKENTCSACGN